MFNCSVNKNPSGPKIMSDIPLKEYFERILTERDNAVRAALAAQEKAVAAAFEASEKAIAKAEAAQKAHDQAANNLRGVLDDYVKQMFPRTEAEGRFNQHAEKIRALELSERAGEGGTKASAQARLTSQWVISLIVGLAGTLIGVFVATR
jgi:hypothetical protein